MFLLDNMHSKLAFFCFSKSAHVARPKCWTIESKWFYIYINYEIY
jgi:hypothetical protein